MGDVLSHACLLVVHLDNDDVDDAEDGDGNDYLGVL